MNMFARFDANPATMTLRVIKETKRYGRMDARTDNVKTVYPLQTKFAGGIRREASHITRTFTIGIPQGGMQMKAQAKFRHVAPGTI